jgi:hypothetical protein
MIPRPANVEPFTIADLVSTSQPIPSPEQVAAEIYDRPGDLEPHQQVYLMAVFKITRRRMRTIHEAAHSWGYGSRAYNAVVHLASNQCRDDLAAALQRYQAAHDEFLEA